MHDIIKLNKQIKKELNGYNYDSEELYYIFDDQDYRFYTDAIENYLNVIKKSNDDDTIIDNSKGLTKLQDLNYNNENINNDDLLFDVSDFTNPKLLSDDLLKDLIKQLKELQ